jgi:hypothetical protein
MKIELRISVIFGKAKNHKTKSYSNNKSRFCAPKKPKSEAEIGVSLGSPPAQAGNNRVFERARRWVARVRAFGVVPESELHTLQE